MRYILLVLGVVLLTSCGTTKEEHLATLRTYKGQTEDQLVKQLGIPSSSYEKDGDRYLTYRSKGSMFLPGTFTNHPVQSSQYVETECENIFMLSQGKVKRVGYRGDCE